MRERERAIASRKLKPKGRRFPLRKPPPKGCPELFKYHQIYVHIISNSAVCRSSRWVWGIDPVM